MRARSKTMITVAAVLIVLAMSLYAFSFDGRAVNAATNVTVESFTVQTTTYYTQESLFEYNTEEGYWYPSGRLYVNIFIEAENQSFIAPEHIDCLGISSEYLPAGSNEVTFKFIDTDDIVYLGQTEWTVTLQSDYLNMNNFVGVKNSFYYGSTPNMMQYEKVVVFDGAPMSVLSDLLMDWTGTTSFQGRYFSFLAQYAMLFLDFNYFDWDTTVLRLDRIADLELLARLEEGTGNYLPIAGNTGEDRWIDGEEQEGISLLTDLSDISAQLDSLYFGLFDPLSEWSSKARILSAFDKQTTDMEKLCYNFVTGEITELENVELSADLVVPAEGEAYYLKEIALDLDAAELLELDINGLPAVSSYSGVATVISVPIALDYSMQYDFVYHSEANIRVPVIDSATVSAYATQIDGNLYLLNEPFMYNNIYSAYIFIGGILPGDNTNIDGNILFDNGDGTIYIETAAFNPVRTDNNVYASISEANSEIKANYSAFGIMPSVISFYKALPLEFCLDVLENGDSTVSELINYTLTPFTLFEGEDDGYELYDSIYDDFIRSYNGNANFVLPSAPGAESFYDGYQVVANGLYASHLPGQTTIGSIGVELAVTSGTELGKYNFIIDRNSFVEGLIEVCFFPQERNSLPGKTIRLGIEVSNDEVSWEPLLKEPVGDTPEDNARFYYYTSLENYNDGIFTWLTNPLIWRKTGTYSGTQFDAADFAYIRITTGFDISKELYDISAYAYHYYPSTTLEILKGLITLELGNEITYGNDVVSTLDFTAENFFEEDFTYGGSTYNVKVLPVVTFYRWTGTIWTPLEQEGTPLSGLIPYINDYPNDQILPLIPGITYRAGIENGVYALYDEVSGTYLAAPQEMRDALAAFTNIRYEQNFFFDSEATDIEVLKGTLEYSVPRQYKTYGELDPELNLGENTEGIRDYDLSRVEFTRVAGEDAGDYPYSIAGKSGFNINTYYNINPISTDVLTITQRELPLQYNSESYEFMPIQGVNTVLQAEAHDSYPYFTLPYGVIPLDSIVMDESGEFYYFYLYAVYMQPLPSVPSFRFSMMMQVRFSSLSVGTDGFIHSLTLVNIAGQPTNSQSLENNVNISIQEGDHFRIVPRIVLIDLSSGYTLSKIFDGTQFTMLFGYGGFSYAFDLAYDEEIQNLTVKGYYENEINDLDTVNNVMAGEKWLYYTDSVFREGKGQPSNYEFRMHNSLKAVINKRSYTFDTRATGNNNSKIYDGEIYQLPYEGYMAVNLVENHYIATPDLKFITQSALANVSEVKLVLSTSDITILDSEGNDFTSSYNLIGTEFGNAKILHRRLELTVNEVMYTTYDANRRYLDLGTGDLYSFDSSTAVLIGNYEIVAKNPIVSYVEGERQTARNAIMNAPYNDSLLFRYSYAGAQYAQMKLTNSAFAVSGRNYIIIEAAEGIAVTEANAVFGMLSAIADGSITVDSRQFFYQGKVYEISEIEPVTYNSERFYFVNMPSRSVIVNTAQANSLLQAIINGYSILNPDGTFTYLSQDYAIVVADENNGIYNSDLTYYYTISAGNVASFLNAQDTGIYAYSGAASQYLRFTLPQVDALFTDGSYYFMNATDSAIIIDLGVLYKIVQSISMGRTVVGGDNTFIYAGKTIKIIKVGSASDASVFTIGEELYYFIDCSDRAFTVTDSALIDALVAVGTETLIYNHRLYRRVECSPSTGIFVYGEAYHYIKSGERYIKTDENALISTDLIGGKLATEVATYGERLLLVSDGTTYFFTVGENTSDKYEVTTSFYVKIDKRAVSVNVSAGAEGSYTLEKTYDGQVYRIDIDAENHSDMVQQRVNDEGVLNDLGHYFAGYGESVSERAGTRLLIFNGKIFGSEGQDLSVNYNISYVQTMAEIYKRPVTVYPYADTSYSASDNDSDGIWDKYYDKTPYVISISNNMIVSGAAPDLSDIGSLVNGLVPGHFVSGSTLTTADGNAFTLDGSGNIIYASGKLAPKQLGYGTPIKISRLVAGAETDETENYDIILAESKVQILPRTIYVNLNKGYPMNSDMTFTYIGAEWVFPVTDLMIVNASGNQALVSGDVVQPGSNFITEHKNVGVTDVLLPSYLYINSNGSGIDDEIYTFNYDLNYYSSYEVEIVKRRLTIDVNMVYSLSERTKVYDGLPYQADLTNTMVTNTNAELNTGLVALHTVDGIIKTADEFFSELPKNLSYIWYNLFDEFGENVISNYDISEVGASATITKRYLPVRINDSGITTMVYNAEKLRVYLTNEKADKEYDEFGAPVNSVDGEGNPLGLIWLDTITEGQYSYRETAYTTVGKYYLNNTAGAASGTGEILIQRDGTGDNLAYNYNIVYVDDEVEILRREVLISVYNTADYSVLDGAIISGFSNYYNSNVFEVNYNYYHTNGIEYNGETYFGANHGPDGRINYDLVSGHTFTAGSRCTATANAGERVLLVNSVDAIVRDSESVNVTANYTFIYVDSYYRIDKRPLLIDAVQGESTAIVEGSYGYFKYDYDRKFFVLTLKDTMVVDAEFPLPAGHTISDGTLTTLSPDVLRDGSGNPGLRPLVWGSRTLKIINTGIAGNPDVTANYDIDTVGATHNFTQRYVKYMPRVLVIDTGVGVDGLRVFSKDYDGTPYEVNINNQMALTILGNKFGLVGDVDEWSITNRDTIMPNTGRLSTADADAGTNKLLTVTHPTKIVNQTGLDVTSNYDIYYYYNIVTVDIWNRIYNNGNIDEEYAEDYLPKAEIRKKRVDIAFSPTDRLRKYFDNTAINITVEYVAGAENSVQRLSGAIFTDNLSRAIRVTGLVNGESLRLSIYSSESGEIVGSVSDQKSLFYNQASTEVVVGKASNYTFNYYSGSGIIIKRPIVIDSTQGGSVISVEYSGAYHYIPITAGMITSTQESSYSLLPTDQGLSFLPGHSISGTLRSMDLNVGLHALSPKPAGNTDNLWVRVGITAGGLDLLRENSEQYAILYADNKIEITKKNVVIQLTEDNVYVSRTKVYDGQPFVIQLANAPGIASGLLANHYITSGYIYTNDANVGAAKTAYLNTSLVRAAAFIEGTSIEIDVTTNYTFSYVPRTLEITRRGLAIEERESLQKPVNGDIYAKLLERNYRFAADGPGTGLVEGDSVRIISYRVRNNVNFNSGFPTPEADGESVTLTFYDIIINNDNYYIISTMEITEKVDTTVHTYTLDPDGDFTLTPSVITGAGEYVVRMTTGFEVNSFITNKRPRVSLDPSEQSVRLFNAQGIEYTYSGARIQPKYNITGINDAPVSHIAYYAAMTSKSGSNLPDISDYDIDTDNETNVAPMDAGLYRLRLSSDDPDYPDWEGYMYTRIKPAQASINFTGALEQTYGSVVNVTAAATSSIGLNEALTVNITPQGNYIYPAAGTYTLSASYNLNGANKNYTSVTATRTLRINQRMLNVVYGNVRTFTYDGTSHTISVALDKTNVISQDRQTVSEANLSIAISGAGSTLRNAGVYQVKASLVNLPNYAIPDESVTVTINKKVLTVSAYVNSFEKATIYEGEVPRITLNYDGFVGGETKANLLVAPTLPYIPRTEVFNYEIMPFGAESNNYEIVYRPAYLTIMPKKQTELISPDKVASISGEYGSYATLEVAQFNADISNPNYYAIYQHVEKNYANTDLLKEYKPALAYGLAISSDETINSDMKLVKLKLPEKYSAEKTYMVVCVDKAGNTTLLTAYSEGGYLMFSTTEIGDFVVLTPKNALSPEISLLLILGPIAVVLIGAFLYFLFRRKY